MLYMNTYTILTTMENVSLICDTNYVMFAMVDGKIYDCYNGKPYNHGGRKLREGTMNLLESMRGPAYDIMERLKEDREMEVNEAVARAIAEMPSKTPESPSKTPENLSTLESMLMDTVAKYATEKALESLLPAVREKVLSEFGPLPVKHEIIIPNRSKVESTEVFHKDFDLILSMLLDGESVYLCGPAGTGKSYIAKQAANALNIPYYCANSVTDDVILKGYKDAMGNYHETEFYKAFTGGGIFLLDELDASIPEVLVLLNNALANGEFPFPGGTEMMHPDFHCIAAGNTYGTGADIEYTGRYVLDAASMDRFALIMVDYDDGIALSMAMGDESLVSFANDFRKVVKSAGIHCLFTYRGIKRLVKFSRYMSKTDAIRIGLTKGLDNSDIAVIATSLNSIKTGDNDWITAFNELLNQ